MLPIQYGNVIIDFLVNDIRDEWSIIAGITVLGMLLKIRQIGVETHKWPVNGTLVGH